MPNQFTGYPPFADRFWAKVDKTDACWLWLAARIKRGYGKLGTAHGPTLMAHRVAWELATGETLTTADHICHICDQPSCVRNDDIGTYRVDGFEYPRRGHLFKATGAVNAADRAAKWRAANPKPPRPRHLNTPTSIALDPAHRWCTECRERKPLDQFVRRTDGGYTSRCKPCRNVRVAAWKQANPEKVREHDRRRDERSRALFGVARAALHARANPEQARARSARKMARLRAEQPEKLKLLYQAAGAVRTAIRRGELVKPEHCEECGRRGRMTAAHWSYEVEHWLDVRWLCSACHGAWDRAHPKLFGV